MKTRMPILILTATLLLIAGLGWCAWPAAQPETAGAPDPGSPRFVVLDVIADSSAERLAAYQVEVTATNLGAGQVRLVGVEGGAPAAFRSAPYYDPAALQGQRVIVGAYSLSPQEQLPQGSARIASVHYQVIGSARPQFGVQLITAGSTGGRTIPLHVSIQERTQP
jgi:hypothetical protein